MFVCKCGRSPSELSRHGFDWVCPCGNGFMDDTDSCLYSDLKASWQLAEAIEKQLREHFEESLPRLVRAILERAGDITGR